MSKRVPSPSSDRSGWRYLGLATQLMVYLVIAVWAGYHLDHKFSIFPLLTAGLPVLMLIIVFYKIIRDTRQ
jgi:hypothetical protein